jgi:uncharacterized protein (DUF952 family)
MTYIYHMAHRDAWQAARADGAYSPPSLADEGFIHLSTRDQIVRVANAIYTGTTGLILLCVDPDQLTAELKWEAPIHPNPDDPVPTDDAELFPHLYGTLNVDAVDAVVAFPPMADGHFTLPPDLP